MGEDGNEFIVVSTGTLTLPLSQTEEMADQCFKKCTPTQKKFH